jgi:hypothetical protein
MNLYKSLVLLVIISITFSCKKEESTICPPTSTNNPNYAQLEVGNYWVYERYEIDTNGNETSLGIIDTCFIEKDTLINEIKYFKYVRPYLNNESTSFVRDSLHYVVTNTGRIIFSSIIFNEVFRVFTPPQGFHEMHEWMTDKDSVISVPLGNFTTVNFQQIFYIDESLQVQSPRYMNYRYAENIGIVSETLPWFYTNPEYTEIRLVDYHLEE